MSKRKNSTSDGPATKKQKLDGELDDALAYIVAFLKTKVDRRPTVGVICGSGLGHLSETLKDPLVIRYEDIQGFPQSTVDGHKSELVFGELGGKYTMCMRGRFHYYEGYTPEQVGLPVRVMAAMGVKVVMVTNAAGGLNTSYRVGDIMIIEDHISLIGLAGLNPLVGQNDARFGPRFPAPHPAYDESISKVILDAREKLGINRPVHRGTYMGVAGPCYETRHEVGFLRNAGGDTVGMSTVFELVAAAHCGMKIMGVSLCTNRCLGPTDDFPAPTHQEVLDAVGAAEKDVQALAEEAITQLNDAQYDDPQGFKHFNAIFENTPAADYVKKFLPPPDCRPIRAKSTLVLA